ncbi:Arabinose operon regulatory protein [Chryseobacterium nakagawai]|uniref:AraC family transcriptional regulator n=1 Tax=Chryseobacterium nakagawai TaxID=1241982 RepID=A0AAD0YR44_CHRNA|nr:AraC family transcriptional regulator [Chryseobacterium nakagawai]AZA93612.1 AraC family transcriptional regulator [Chryseobacterium nakagawai]VEH20312.1 Arabinose operon regulatory protein [Chryseobacterium nakagawai]
MEIKQVPTKLADNEIAYKRIEGIENYNKTTKCTYFLLVLFSEGSGTHFIDDKSYPIGKQQLHFLFPGQHHHWETGAETIAQKIVIGQKVFSSFSSTDEFHFIRHNLHPVFKLSDSIYHTVNKEIQSIENDIVIHSENGAWNNILLLRMDILASIMKREAETYIKENLLISKNQTIEKYWELVNQQFITEKKTSAYAEQLCVTSNYLNILCKKHLNITASDIIKQKVIQEAKQKLKFSDNSIKEISYELGFESLISFSTYFKKNTGFSPSSYRESH